MPKLYRRSTAFVCTVAFCAASIFAADIPKPLKSRFIVGDPVWRELLIRDDLKTKYEKCWQTAVTTLLENNFDVATMDKDSGYIRTTENTNVVVLNGDWVYKVQISIKYVYDQPIQALRRRQRPTSRSFAFRSPGRWPKRARGHLSTTSEVTIRWCSRISFRTSKRNWDRADGILKIPRAAKCVHDNLMAKV